MTPSQPRQRHELLAHWRGPGRAQLADCLRRRDAAGFDQRLIDHVAHRITPRFYFRPQDVPERLRQARRAAPEDVARWLRDGSIRTTHAHGNALIQPQLLPGQKTTCEKTVWSPSYGQKEPAIRFTVRQKARHARFITVIVAYPGRIP